MTRRQRYSSSRESGAMDREDIAHLIGIPAIFVFLGIFGIPLTCHLNNLEYQRRIAERTTNPNYVLSDEQIVDLTSNIYQTARL